MQRATVAFLMNWQRTSLCLWAPNWASLLRFCLALSLSFSPATLSVSVSVWERFDDFNLIIYWHWFRTRRVIAIIECVCDHFYVQCDHVSKKWPTKNRTLESITISNPKRWTYYESIASLLSVSVLHCFG